MKLRAAVFLLFLLVVLFCVPPIASKGGRGGGGSRSSSSSSSRSSSSRSSSSRASSTSSQSSQRTASSSNSNRQSHTSSTDRRTSDKDTHRESPVRVKPSAPEMPDVKPSAPKSSTKLKESNPNPYPYNPHFSEVGKPKARGHSSADNSDVINRPGNAPNYGSGNANAPVINPSLAGVNQPGSIPNIASKQSNSGNPPAPGFIAGNVGNPPAPGFVPGTLGNPPPYSSGPGHLGNPPPPYGAGPGHLGNPPPYGVGPGHLGNPPPYGAGPGHLGNPPPYGAGPGHLGNPPPYGTAPDHLGNLPPNYQRNPPAHGPGLDYRGNPLLYGSGAVNTQTFGIPGQSSPYGGSGSYQSGYPSSSGINSGKPFHGPSISSGGFHPSTRAGSATYSSLSGLSKSERKLKIHKRKSFLNSLLSLGKGSKGSKKPKMFSLAYPQNQYSKHQPRRYGVSPLYPILPMRMLHKQPKSLKVSKYVKHWMFPRNSLYGEWRRRNFFNLDDGNNFGGRRCYKPNAPKNGGITCYQSNRGMTCDAKCNPGYIFPNNTYSMEVYCWHFNGYWRPTKYLQECIPYCREKCQNGGKCIGPDKCRCTAEFRGPQCQDHFLRCDIRQHARGNPISWVCSHSVEETSCTVSCRPPRVFVSLPPANKYHCFPNGTWTPDYIPLCV